MIEIKCPSCTGEDLAGTKLPTGNIQLTCEHCGHVWERVPGNPCPRCGSGDVNMSVYEGWAFDDIEEAREDPMASWEYVEKTVFRCQKCHKEWIKAGESSRPPARRPPRPNTPPISIGDLWERLTQHEGETFTQIRGGEFAYGLTPSAVLPDRTHWQIPRGHLEEALSLVPLDSTVAVQHLFGPSYIYTLLMDRRIRKTDW